MTCSTSPGLGDESISLLAALLQRPCHYRVTPDLTPAQAGCVPGCSLAGWIAPANERTTTSSSITRSLSVLLHPGHGTHAGHSGHGRVLALGSGVGACSCCGDVNMGVARHWQCVRGSLTCCAARRITCCCPRPEVPGSRSLVQSIYALASAGPAAAGSSPSGPSIRPC